MGRAVDLNQLAIAVVFQRPRTGSLASASSITIFFDNLNRVKLAERQPLKESVRHAVVVRGQHCTWASTFLGIKPEIRYRHLLGSPEEDRAAA